MRCLFCLCPPKRYSIPHFFIAIIQFFCINKQPTLLAQQPAFTSFTKHFQYNNKATKNIFHSRRIALSSQVNCPFHFSLLFPSQKKHCFQLTISLLLAYNLTAFSLQSHCFYSPISQLLPRKNIAFAPPMHHPMKTKFIFKS